MLNSTLASRTCSTYRMARRVSSAEPLGCALDRRKYEDDRLIRDREASRVPAGPVREGYVTRSKPADDAL